MSWEDISDGFDHRHPESITIVMDLAHFAELVGRVASECHRWNDLDVFDPHSPEAQTLAVDAWRYVCHMTDRAEFAKSVSADLEALAVPPPSSEHLPEFGGAAPLPDHAPDALNRRLEPPV